MTTPPHLDNPAGRLQSIFERAKAYPQGTRATKAWSDLFGVDVAKPWLLTEQFGEMARMLTDVRSQLGLIPEDDDPELATRHLHEIEQVLANVAALGGNSMEWHLTPLTQAGMYSLAQCSSLLHRRRPEAVVSESVAASLREQVSRLIEDVRSADDLDAKTRQTILSRLNDVYEALRMFDLRGGGGLRTAADSLFGSFLTDGPAWRRGGGSKVREGLYALLVAVDLALNLTANYATISGPPEPSPVIIEYWTNVTGCEPPTLRALPAAGPAAESSDTDSD